jgi:hypothetical protein
MYYLVIWDIWVIVTLTVTVTVMVMVNGVEKVVSDFE